MNLHHYIFIALITTLGFLIQESAHGENNATNETTSKSALDNEIQNIKQEALRINRELFMIEEDILYPDITQVMVFVSLDIGEFFQLDSVQLRIDDKIVANYLYTDREIDALKKGGVQRLYQGNLKNGEHELTAYFIGKGPRDRDYKRGATRTINKSMSPVFVELRIIDEKNQQQPDFDVAIWDQ